MQQKKLAYGAVGIAAAGLCAVLATTAIASPGHGTTAQAKPQTTHQSQTAVKESAAAKAKASSSAGSKSRISEENRLLLNIQREIKVTTGNPTAAQVVEADKLVGQLKAKGNATAAQLAWLSLTPGQKRVEAAPVGAN
ncbi:hypothetical protein [Streptomyces sp. NBC_00986]|uniref:hypothetical protein n=1 Tax=Streptomyces sp. NBC_00986 TaxID=2903702 RepID=UPI00386D1CB3|nr:hypothetical protein OG504_02265 [Streptomyces sp. NBC_00986]